MIQILEQEALKTNVSALDHVLLEESRQAGKRISEAWLSQSRILPKLGQQKYFLPIPVALVAII